MGTRHKAGPLDRLPKKGSNEFRQRRTLNGAGALVLFAGLTGTAFAQQADPQAAAPGLEEVVVTGTRIVASGMVTPTPVTAVSSRELQNMAPGPILDSLTQLPQFFATQTSNQVNGGQNSGGSNVNLRGAGVNRTLVLLDGRRLVSSNRFGTVDVGMLPDDLIQRVETVTGGASASYGTDAVAGVVNFILDTNFTGLKVHAEGGETGYHDGENGDFRIAYGTDIGQRVHVLASLQHYNLNAIDSFDSLKKRSFIKEQGLVTNPDPNGPTWLRRDWVAASNFSNYGIINQPGFKYDKYQFNADGTLGAHLPTNVDGQLNGGCNCLAYPTPNYSTNADENLTAGLERANAFLYIDGDVTDNINVYAQYINGRNKVFDPRESISFLNAGSWQPQIYVDNAYLPQAVKDEMNAEGLTSIGFGELGLNSPDSPIGQAAQLTTNHLYQATLGFKANIPESAGFLHGWNVNGYWQYGINNQSFDEQNGIRVDRTPLALDAVVDPSTGTIVCRAALIDPYNFGDCEPMNIFGGVQHISPLAANYIVDQYKHASQHVAQQVAEVVLSGDIAKGFNSAGPISGAFGLSYRGEQLSQATPDPTDEFPATPSGILLSDLTDPVTGEVLLPAGIRGLVPYNAVGGACGTPADYHGIRGLRDVPTGYCGDNSSSAITFSSLRTISGGLHVKEAFSEINIPLLADAPLAKDLSLNTAVRWADYSGSGSIWAYKAGISWQVTDKIRVRATQSRDVRAATLQERYDQTRGGTNVTDPLNNDALISTASFSGGNPNVDPEKADTTTVGVVIQPTNAISLSVDTYKININDAIAQLRSQDVVDKCAAGDMSLCQYVHRDPTNNNKITRVDNLFINLSNQLIRGTDLELDWRTSLLNWRLFATWLPENSIKNPGAARDNRAGDVGRYALPKEKVTTSVSYEHGPLSVFLQERWISSGLLDHTKVEGVDIDDNTVPSAYYTDLHIAGNLGQTQQFQVYLTINNLFDQAPRATPNVVGRTGVNPFNSALYDVLGRRFVIGANMTFGGLGQ